LLPQDFPAAVFLLLRNNKKVCKRVEITMRKGYNYYVKMCIEVT